MPFSANQVADLVAELNGETVRICHMHMFDPSQGEMPPRGCKQCQLAFWMWVMKHIPPDKRREKLEELQMIAHHMAELEDKGKLDMRLYPHPVLERDSE